MMPKETAKSHAQEQLFKGYFGETHQSKRRLSVKLTAFLPEQYSDRFLMP